MLSISEGRIAEERKALPFKKTRHRRGVFLPEGIVLHDTAGSLERHSSVDWFLNARAKASAHFVSRGTEKITQMAKLDEQCWHAGNRNFENRPRVNELAYGIEIVNMGEMAKTSEGAFNPWFDSLFFQGDAGLRVLHAETPQHGSGYWHGYSVEQIEAVTAPCRVLSEEMGAKWITAHWFISPGRKVDTNHLFPIDDLREAIFGGDAGGEKYEAIAPVNQRRWPSYKDNIIQVVPKGQIVNGVRSGSFKHHSDVEEVRYLVEFRNHKGWANANDVKIRR